MFRTLLTTFLIIACGSLMAQSEGERPEGVPCTEEFKMISMSVKGDTLDDFYTIRLQTGDIIRYKSFKPRPSGPWYLVINDEFRGELKHRSEPFLFIGLIDGKVVVEEKLEIGADDCHIQLIRGQTTVEIKG